MQSVLQCVESRLMLQAANLLILCYALKVIHELKLDNKSTLYVLRNPKLHHNFTHGFISDRIYKTTFWELFYRKQWKDYCVCVYEYTDLKSKYDLILSSQSTRSYKNWKTMTEMYKSILKHSLQRWSESSFKILLTEKYFNFEVICLIYKSVGLAINLQPNMTIILLCT